jgi:arginine repressor
MNDSRNDRLLSSALRAVAEDDEMLLHAPPGVEAKLLAEVRAIDRMRRSRRLAVVAGGAAGLLVGR